MLSRHASILVCTALVIPLATTGWAHNVSGTIKDENGAVIADMKLVVMQGESGQDEEVGTTYTDGNGSYSVNGAETGKYVYIIVVFEMQLTGALANGKDAYMCYNGAGQRCEYPSAGLAGGLIEDISGDVVINIPTGGSGPTGSYAPGGEIQAIKYAQHDLDYFVNQGISSQDWVCPCDLGIDVYMADTDANARFHANGSDGQCEVGIYWVAPLITYSKTGIYHEFAHVFQYKEYGNWPATNYPGWRHYISSAYDEGFAVCEGWAELVQHRVGIFKSLGGIQGLSATTWRGNNAGYDAQNEQWNRPNATASGTDFSGEVCEGAVMRSWNELDFADVFAVIMEDEPETARQFALDLLERFTTEDYDTLMEHYAENGIVYTRAALDGFDEGAPPDDAPASSGNAKVINEVMFLRAAVTLDKSQVSAATLNLDSSVIAISYGQLLYKSAQDAWENAVFYKNGPWTSAGTQQWTNDFVWNTKYVPGSDGDYDIILRSTDENGYGDTFYPDFNGDPGPYKTQTISGTAYNEKWLKYQGAWYYDLTCPGGDPPSTANKNKGKVIIDNTAPTISNTKP